MRIAGTGHRPDKLGGYLPGNPIELQVRAWIRDSFYRFRPDAVMSGMALGFDTWLAQEALGMGIPLHAAVPFTGQEAKWTPEAITIYRGLLKRCASVTTLGDHYRHDLFQKRNAFMVDWLTMRGDDKLLACWNGSDGGTAKCVRYAEFRKVCIERFDFAGVRQ